MATSPNNHYSYWHNTWTQIQHEGSIKIQKHKFRFAFQRRIYISHHHRSALTRTYFAIIRFRKIITINNSIAIINKKNNMTRALAERISWFTSSIVINWAIIVVVCDNAYMTVAIVASRWITSVINWPVGEAAVKPNGRRPQFFRWGENFPRKILSKITKKKCFHLFQRLALFMNFSNSAIFKLGSVIEFSLCRNSREKKNDRRYRIFHKKSWKPRQWNYIIDEPKSTSDT